MRTKDKKTGDTLIVPEKEISGSAKQKDVSADISKLNEAVSAITARLDELEELNNTVTTLSMRLEELETKPEETPEEK